MYLYIADTRSTKNEVIYECDAPIDIVLYAVCCFVYIARSDVDVRKCKPDQETAGMMYLPIWQRARAIAVRVPSCHRADIYTRLGQNTAYL